MKFVIELDDFYLDEDGDLVPALKRYVVDEVLRTIYKKIEEKVQKQIAVEVKAMVEKTLYKKTSVIISDVLKNEEVMKPGYSKEKVKIEEYIRLQFEDRGGWSNPNDHIKSLADKFAKELKERYDIIFATHIVAKVNEQGMLKENVAKLLLEDVNGKKK